MDTASTNNPIFDGDLMPGYCDGYPNSAEWSAIKATVAALDSQYLPAGIDVVRSLRTLAGWVGNMADAVEKKQKRIAEREAISLARWEERMAAQGHQAGSEGPGSP